MSAMPDVPLLDVEGHPRRWVFQCPVCERITVRLPHRQNGCLVCQYAGRPLATRQALIPLRPAEDWEKTREHVTQRVEPRLPMRPHDGDEWVVGGSASSLDGEFAVAATVDRFYEEETALYRVPAALNWPHGRIRPRCRLTNEGKARGFWVGRRRERP